jgi:DNA polymerase III delta subunit
MTVSVYYGDEPFLREKALLELRQNTIQPAMGSLSHKVLNQPRLSDVIEALSMVSMAFGGKTLIEIRDFPWLAQASKDKTTDDEIERLKVLLLEEDMSKVVLFYSVKIDGKIKFPKWLLSQSGFEIRRFEALKFWELDKAQHFIQQYAKNTLNLSVEHGAAVLLSETVGIDFRTLANELEKLALIHHGHTLTEAMIRKNAYHSDNLFRLVDRWILEQDATDNWNDLSEMLLRRHPIELFATIQGYFNTIFRIIWLTHHGLRESDIAIETGQKPFTIKKHLGHFRHVPLARWVKLKQLLVHMEFQSKTGQLEAQMALEMALAS